jgi:hypothetical protein
MNSTLPAPVSSARRRVMVCLLLCYVAGIVGFGVRPFIAPLYRGLYGSDLGAWNMYSSKVFIDQTAYLLAPDGTRRALDAYRHFWHQPFVSTTHGHVLPQSLDAFTRYFAATDQVASLVPDDASGSGYRVVLELRMRRNDGPWEMMRSTATVGRRHE